MSSLRILSFNTQLRSWAMQVGDSPGLTIPPIDTSEERATLIADAILNSPFDYDIVGLCEVFDEDARDIFVDKLDGRFPYMITKCDWNYLRHVNGNSDEEDLRLLATWQIVGQPPTIENSWRLEDSGLMLFSRWPFATIDTSTIDPSVIAVLSALGISVPAQFPAVNFLPYVDTQGHDGHSCKGVAYMRVERNHWTRYHVFFSHTQADDNSLEEHRDARGKQIAAVETFVDACVDGPPHGEEVFFMGDLNIFGEQANSAVANKEWKTYFDSPPRLLSERMVDLWGRRQCTGAPGGLRDPGYSATVRYPPQEQRLDYIFGLAKSSLAAQHLSIDYALAEVPPGIDDVSYLSDHRPLRIDLALPRRNSTPYDADKPNWPQPPPALQLFVDDNQLLMQGQVKWYRFDQAGTYDFMVYSHNEEWPVAYEVYLDTDLSRPRRQYRQEGNADFGQRFVLTTPPFLVKVFPLRRDGEQLFTFSAHRHQGRGPEDALVLPYGVTVEDTFPDGGQVLNDDNPSTGWDDRDTKWFRLDGPQIDLARELDVTISVATQGVDCSVALAEEVGPGNYDLIDEQSGAQNYELRTTTSRGRKHFVQVRRNDGPSPGPLHAYVTARSNVSILLGGQRGAPRLLCQDETSGWGADDIALEVRVDGTKLVHISNDDIGDFDQDDVRELNQWIPDLVPYFDGVEFLVIELDDTSPDDTGSETLPLRDQLSGWARWSPTKTDPDGTVRGAFGVDVDDGTYAVQVAVTTWDETF